MSVARASAQAAGRHGSKPATLTMSVAREREAREDRHAGMQAGRHTHQVGGTGEATRRRQACRHAGRLPPPAGRDRRDHNATTGRQEGRHASTLTR